jgi:mono/diheme cytochrome c family protein
MPARPWRAVALGGILLSAALAVGTLNDAPASSAVRPTTPLPLATPHPGDVALGRKVYLQNCASCHGTNAEGAANWLEPDARGNLPPPPHDDTGHTWRHSDAELAEIIRNGMRDIFNKTPDLTMPPFKDRLSDEEIAAVIAYFKSLWSDEHRRFQEEQNRRLPMPMATPGTPS